ncbi:DMT family transporter, partial [Salmonella enterica subsp. enterica serovar Infantis]
MHKSLTIIFLIAAGVWLVLQNSIMVRITQTS